MSKIESYPSAPSPSKFPLLNHFWIYFTCGFDIRDIRVYLGHWCPVTSVKGLRNNRIKTLHYSDDEKYEQIV